MSAAADELKGLPIKPAFSALWTSEADWPLDTKYGEREFIFWGRALQRIGRAMFPEWEGPEFGIEAAPVLSPWPRYISGGQNAPPSADLTRAQSLVAAHDPDAVERFSVAALTLKRNAALAALASRPAQTPGSLGPPRKKYGIEEVANALPPVDSLRASALRYGRAEEIAAEIDRVGKPYRDRAVEVARRVSEACAMGELATSFVWPANGRLYRFDEGWWNADGAWRWSRFVLCKIDRLNATAPPKRNDAPREPCWIYVERAALDAFLASLAAGAPSAPWTPLPQTTLKHWCGKGGEAETAAKERLKALGNANPAEAHVSGELAAMWNLSAARPTTKASVKATRARQG